MKFFLIIFIFSLSNILHAEEAPILPAQGATLESFTPKGWVLLKKAEGDLNGDQVSDVAVVFDKDIPLKERKPDVADRLLVILFKTKEGYALSASSLEVVRCVQCGGSYGDPFQEIKIANKVVQIDHYGGTSWRWGEVDKFRYQNNGWFLIGHTQISSYDMYEVTSDSNLSTGSVVYSWGTEGEKKEEKKAKLLLKPIPLAEISNDQLHPLLQTVEKNCPYSLTKIVEEQNGE